MSANFVAQARALLTADATVTALVGARIYPGKLPQSPTFPAVRCTVISDAGLPSLGGNTSGKQNGRLQVDCYAKTYDGAQSVGNAVSAVLASYSTPSLTSLQVSRRDLYEDQTELFGVSIDLSLWSNDT